MFVNCIYTMKKEIIIAIDGHSSTGKSSFAKQIASKYQLIYVDTGALYRGVTLIAMRSGIDNLDNPSQLDRLMEILNSKVLSFKPSLGGVAGELLIDGESAESEIRGLEVANRVSKVASHPRVRNYVDNILKGYGKKRGVVMDGRDIGTVVFPDADIKIFMTADAEVRARRRYREIVARGDDANYDDVLKNVKERDYLDENRETAPLRVAEDAILLDNSKMTEEDQMIWIEKILSENLG